MVTFMTARYSSAPGQAATPSAQVSQVEAGRCDWDRSARRRYGRDDWLPGRSHFPMVWGPKVGSELAGLTVPEVPKAGPPL